VAAEAAAAAAAAASAAAATVVVRDGASASSATGALSAASASAPLRVLRVTAAAKGRLVALGRRFDAAEAEAQRLARRQRKEAAFRGALGEASRRLKEAKRRLGDARQRAAAKGSDPRLDPLVAQAQAAVDDLRGRNVYLALVRPEPKSRGTTTAESLTRPLAGYEPRAKSEGRQNVREAIGGGGGGDGDGGRDGGGDPSSRREDIGSRREEHAMAATIPLATGGWVGAVGDVDGVERPTDFWQEVAGGNEGRGESYEGDDFDAEDDGSYESSDLNAQEHKA
jgi:hypothetical protein